MKFPLLCLLAASVAGLSGCAGGSGRYTRIYVTNFRGELESEWVARGRLRPVDGGYQITAVERSSPPRFSLLSRYPDGWPATVLGPHIRTERTEKPQWLIEHDGDER